jgi:4-hydroxybenzoate polyprenyltransferase
MSRSSLLYHLKTLLLFTSDQILDTVIPGTAFGAFAAVSGPVLGLPAQETSAVVRRLPRISIWLWLMILQFCVQNQRHTSSVEEDSINKWWRPIPARRITQENTVSLLSSTYILNCAISYHLDVQPIYLAWTVLGTIYNDFGGGDHSGLSRNIFCGALFCCTFSGALSIGLGPSCDMSYRAWQWTLLMTLGMIGSTIHTQDFRDEIGDKARGRRTLVLEMGRRPAMLSVVVGVSFWSLYLPLSFFASDWTTAMLSMVLGAYLVIASFRAMGGHDAKRDRRMYKTWCLWIGVYCGLPALVRVTGELRSVQHATR